MSTLACGCPGSQVRTIEKIDNTHTSQDGNRPSELRQWPTQLHS